MKKLVFALLLCVLAFGSTPTQARVPIETSVNQMKLAVDVDFLQRMQYTMVQQARVVLAETGIGATAHRPRDVRAQRHQQSGLIGTVTVDGAGKATTTVTDAALLSQVATYWSALAGVDSGS